MASDAELSLLVGAGTRAVDLGGRLLMPGFIDAHAHPVQGGLELRQCNLTGARGADDCVSIVAAYAAAYPECECEWVTGGGWSMAHFPGGTPAAAPLDAVVPDRPVYLVNRDHHGAWVNSAALRLAGIDRDTHDPSDGRIERDAAGNPTGTLHEGASLLVQALLPAVSLDEAVAGVARGQEEMFSFGVTGWADAWVGKTGGMESIFDAYMAALDRDVLRARVTGALWSERGAGLEQVEAFVRLREAVKRANGSDAAARVTLAHHQVVGERDVARFAPVGAIANLQMLWAAVDEQLDELTFPFLDPALVARHCPFGDLVRAGAQIACGSDWPVSTPNPWEAIAVGLTRAEEGREADQRIGLHQRLDLPTMLDAYTAGSAHSNGRGDTTGRLDVGFAADLVVLDDDPFTIAPERLRRVGVGQTWVGGAQVAGAHV